MKILNFGSMNYDYVYNVDHIMLPGETQSSTGLNTYLGGKGMNQSVALARAGLEVYHAGMLGEEGQQFLDQCKADGIKTDYIKVMPGKSGHTIIQIDKEAQNCIMLYGGANQLIDEAYVDEVLANFSEGDYLVLQNEISSLPYIIDKAYEIGMKIVLNPSPYDANLDKCDLTKVSLFFLNEVEGGQNTGLSDPDAIIKKLVELYNANIVLTLGKDGAMYYDGENIYKQGIFEVDAVDTTAAGDTFTGYFIAGLINDMEPQKILELSSKASSICITREGAIPSIPKLNEVIGNV